MTHSLINQSQLINNIDRLVRDVVFQPIYFNDVRNRLNALYYPFMNSINHDLYYSQTVDSFVYSTDAIVGDLYPCDVIWDHDKTQQFVNNLAYYRNIIETEDNVWRQQEVQNKVNLEHYIRNLIKHYSRLLFVRVDLKYSQESSHLITIEDFNLHMTKLREFIGNKKTCFANLQGNAWALEQGGIEGGLHCHLLLIYDGAKRQNDWYLAKEVGEKWRSITENMGAYYNYHDAETKRRFEENGKLGIGMIHRDNPQQVENAVHTALYLTKPDKVDQQLKVWLPSMRTFGHGIYRTAKRRGLPPIAN
ncbi:inovirus-type Gp2 protein [Psychrobacter sp. GW64-MNA-CIBAN-0177]|uniref:YagK/YfjJ domain-containing protein n=1 Tax=Psychrobacter sp. GW64-MNA-CIBAN-0177 TaxID=3140449 RepID=UPI0033228A02